jgi:hypothetical protein
MFLNRSNLSKARSTVPCFVFFVFAESRSKYGSDPWADVARCCRLPDGAPQIVCRRLRPNRDLQRISTQFKIRGHTRVAFRIQLDVRDEVDPQISQWATVGYRRTYIHTK